MSIKLEDYGIVPEWAIDKRIVSETKFPLGAKSDSICSHCNKIITPGESHIPCGDLNIPSRGGSFKHKQCMSIRMN